MLHLEPISCVKKKVASGQRSVGYLQDVERMHELAAESCSQTFTSDSSDDETIVSITRESCEFPIEPSYSKARIEKVVPIFRDLCKKSARKTHRASELKMKRSELRNINGIIEISPNWFCLLSDLVTIENIHEVIDELKKSYGTSWSQKINGFNKRTSLGNTSTILQNLSVTEHIESVSLYALCTNGSTFEHCEKFFPDLRRLLKNEIERIVAERNTDFKIQSDQKPIS